jgi:hypothetical protein
MQIRQKLLAALVVMGVPLSAQTSKPRYLPESDHMCKATMTDGTAYEVRDRLLATELNGKPSYLPVRGLYRPGSGEFLWRASVGFTDKEHAIEMMGKSPKDGICPENSEHILLLQGGEWADFVAWNGNITVFHSNLKFHTPEEAWSYVADHWQDADTFLVGGNTSKKFVEQINLDKQLGADFSRPKRLEFSAQGYVFYYSLGSVKKVGQNWELEIKGADESNRATVLLDNNFKLIAVTKNGMRIPLN